MEKKPNLRIKIMVSLIASVIILGFQSCIDGKKEHHAAVAEMSVSRVDSNRVRAFVDEKPQYPTGSIGLESFLANNTNYPQEAADKNIKGSVIVKFVVEKDGTLSNIEPVVSLDSLCDKEAVRVVKAMPKWNPGSEKGINVPVYYNLAVNFPNKTPDIEELPIEQVPMTVNTTATSSPVFTFVEQMPSFPGGSSELMKYLGTHLTYPSVASENGIQGRVILSFVVEKDGSVSNVKVVRPLESSLDREALRVVKAMPKWIPGKQHGKPVAVFYNLPIIFKLQD